MISFKRTVAVIKQETKPAVVPQIQKTTTATIPPKSDKPTLNIVSVVAKPKTKKEPEPPPKKKGRPSNEELERKAKEKLDLENKIKDQLVAQAENPGSQAVVEIENKKVVVDYPVFKIGEYVKDKVGISRFIHKGIVVRQDIGSRFVCVDWRDGSRQYHSAESLERITLKEYKKRERNEPPAPEPLTKEERDIVETLNAVSGALPSMIEADGATTPSEEQPNEEQL